MASISFEVLDNSNPGIGSGISASGLGFYGSGGFGTSVPLLNYQGKTFVTSSDGTNQGPEARNVQYTTVSGCTISAGTGLLSKINSSEATLVVNFDHTASVKVQNAQLRIYDRDNIDNPATGVITKIAEIANFGGGTISYSTWVGNNGNDILTTVGSGDAFWWGAPWPNTHCYTPFQGTTANRPYYQNSVGVKFYNFTDVQDAANSGNPHPSLSGLSSPGKQTVGGSGLIVPLLDSPGSGGRGLASPLHTGAPKYCQYINATSQGTLLGANRTFDSGSLLASMYGGTGADTRHTWRIAISSAPLSIGSKTQFGMYISLEYL